MTVRVRPGATSTVVETEMGGPPPTGAVMVADRVPRCLRLPWLVTSAWTVKADELMSVALSSVT